MLKVEILLQRHAVMKLVGQVCCGDGGDVRPGTEVQRCTFDEVPHVWLSEYGRDSD
jgi:hypothetical protein